MRWLILWTAMVAAAFGQDENFSGTVFDLDTGRTQVISGSINDPDRGHNERMSRMRQMNAELETSIATMRQESEMRQQTREMREQTELLRNMAKEKSGGPSSSYVPPPIVVAPSSYVAPTAAAPAAEINKALNQAKFSMSFDADTVRRVKSPGSDHVSNEIVTKRLVAAYKGDFTDYKWRSEKIDSQTYMVFCEVLLDGQKYDFKFKVNTEIESCRYEGGTALGKLAPPKAFTPPPPIPDKQTANSESNEWWKEGSEPVEDSAPKPPKIAEKFDPDAYLAEKTTNSAKNKITFLDEEPTKTSEDLSFLDAHEPKLPRVLSTEEFNKKLSKMSAIPMAKNRQNFSGFGQKPVEGVVSDPVEEDSNSQLITEWIENYAGEFADYGWRSEPIDAQTFLVVCEVSLDGEKHDFRFQVNTELMTCRYEGGTAYEKLRSSQKKGSWWPW